MNQKTFFFKRRLHLEAPKKKKLKITLKRFSLMLLFIFVLINLGLRIYNKNFYFSFISLFTVRKCQHDVRVYFSLRDYDKF